MNEPKEAPAKDARELVGRLQRMLGLSLQRADEAAAEIERFVASRLARAPSPSLIDALTDLSGLVERAHKTGKDSIAVEYAASVARRCLAALLSSPSSVSHTCATCGENRGRCFADVSVKRMVTRDGCEQWTPKPAESPSGAGEGE
jgi:hypothetical protein